MEKLLSLMKILDATGNSKVLILLISAWALTILFPANPLAAALVVGFAFVAVAAIRIAEAMEKKPTVLVTPNMIERKGNESGEVHK